MTTASAEQSKAETKTHFDPDEFRMTIGEHLEELRKRLVYGLLGFVVAVGVCMYYGEHILTIFCAPLYWGLRGQKLNPQLITKGVTEGFMTYLQISIVTALVIAGPWIVYQLWLFVAAGLYPTERKTITRYIPLSITLLISGVLFVYFLVLPLSISFFISFTSTLPAPHKQTPIVNTTVVPVFPVINGDPKKPVDGSIWYNTDLQQIRIRVDGVTRLLMFAPDNLLSPQFTLDEYVNLVLMFMLVFAAAFQLPLVLLALVTIGVVDIEFLKKRRRIVYFIMAIVAAVIAPGDIITSMLALLIPLLVLYEFGIWLAQWGEKRRKREFEQAMSE